MDTFEPVAKKMDLGRPAQTGELILLADMKDWLDGLAEAFGELTTLVAGQPRIEIRPDISDQFLAVIPATITRRLEDEAESAVLRTGVSQVAASSSQLRLMADMISEMTRRADEAGFTLVFTHPSNVVRANFDNRNGLAIMMRILVCKHVDPVVEQIDQAAARDVKDLREQALQAHQKLEDVTGQLGQVHEQLVEAQQKKIADDQSRETELAELRAQMDAMRQPVRVLEIGGEQYPLTPNDMSMLSAALVRGLNGKESEFVTDAGQMLQLDLKTIEDISEQLLKARMT